MFAMIFTTSDSLRTLPVAIGQMSKSYSVYWNELMAASCLSSVPLIVVFVFLQRYFISNMTGGAVKNKAQTNRNFETGGDSCEDSEHGTF